jgi:hypothetical protein
MRASLFDGWRPYQLSGHGQAVGRVQSVGVSGFGWQLSWLAHGCDGPESHETDPDSGPSDPYQDRTSLLG